MSYYAVSRGQVPGIYDNWSECEKQIKGYSNAKFKKFAEKEDAKLFMNQTEEITTEYPTQGIAVDAAYSMKKGEGEYQMYDLSEKRMVYNSGIYKDVTVNIMEFLAIVKAIQLYPNQDIYSDSATAISWLQKKSIKSVGKCEQQTQDEINSALDYLRNNVLTNRIIKWNTSVFKDIPADFQRK